MNNQRHTTKALLPTALLFALSATAAYGMEQKITVTINTIKLYQNNTNPHKRHFAALMSKILSVDTPDQRVSIALTLPPIKLTAKLLRLTTEYQDYFFLTMDKNGNTIPQQAKKIMRNDLQECAVETCRILAQPWEVASLKKLAELTVVDNLFHKQQ